MAEILLVRHGQASFGSDDYDCLSPLGERQARLVGDFLADSGVQLSACFAGTLKRQQQSAAAVYQAYSERGIHLPALRTEAGFNEVENEMQVKLLAPQLAVGDPEFAALLEASGGDKKAFQKVLRRSFMAWQEMHICPSGLQSWADYRRGVMEALHSVMRAGGKGQTLAVFTSGGTIATIVASALGLPDRGVYQVFEPVINSSITRLLYSGDRYSLSAYNEHSYLSALADPGVLTYR